MYRTINILFITFLLGFFLVPIEASACSFYTKEIIKKEKSCCDHSSDHQSKQTCKKDCCKDNGGDSSCSGNCSAKSCHNSAQTFCAQIVGNSYHTFKYEEENSYPSYKQPYYSSGFHSIWQPPKIG